MSLQLVSQGTAVLPPANVRLDLFPTPVFVWRWSAAETHKDALVEAIGRRREAPQIGCGGWRSSDHLPAWPEPAIQALTHWVAGCIQEASLGWREGVEAEALAQWRAGGWAEAVPAAAGTPLHCSTGHGWNWSAYYCLNVAGAHGALIFEDRGNGIDFAASRTRRSRRHVVSEGQLVAFPALLHHRIEPHLFGNEHLWIGYNLYNAALEEPRSGDTEPAAPRWSLASLLRRALGRTGGKPAAGNRPPAGVNIEL